MASSHILNAVTLVPAISALLATYIVTSLYLNYRKYPQFKGPFLASISGLWLFRETSAGRMYASCADALEKYGRQQLPTSCSLFLSHDQARLSGSSPT
jgi:hypothetical protein